MPLPVSTAQLLDLHSDRVQEEIHTVLPARVLSYDAAKQTVDVEFSVRVAVRDEEGEPEWETLPNLAGVPVAWMRGGGFFFAASLAAGDSVWVYATTAAIGQWRATGKVPSDGPETRRHGLGSCFAVPGAFPSTAPLADASGSELRLGKDGNNAQIHIVSGEIRLGKGATDFVALASKVDQCMTELGKHVHPVTAVGSPTGPPATGVASGSLTLPATGSSLVKVRP